MSEKKEKTIFFCPICGKKDDTKQSITDDPIWKEIKVLNCGLCASTILICDLVQYGRIIRNIEDRFKPKDK